MHIWHSEVKKEDIDFQDIVYHANYLEYFDYARRNILEAKGIYLDELHRNGVDVVIAHVELTLKKSLKLHDKFDIKTTFHRSGRLRVIFNQKIYLADRDTLVAEATTTIVCVSVQTGKPVLPDAIALS